VTELELARFAEQDEGPAVPGGPLVRFHHVFKVYRIVDTGVVALAGVDFDIGRGEFLAVVGPSGSGKSTVLNLAGGLDRASAGEVEFEGQDLGRLDEGELSAYRRDKVGFVWQGTARNLVPYLSLRENVNLPLIATGKRAWTRRKRVDELLEAVGLRDRARHRPGQLSGGEQQRAAVAVALANLPALLLADEPTAELDSESAERVLLAFRDVNKEFGVTVVMVTHDLLASRRADRTIRIRDGKLAPEIHPARPVSPEGAIRLPGQAVDALYGSDLEVDVAGGEVRIRRAEARRRRRLGREEADAGESEAGEVEVRAAGSDDEATEPAAEPEPQPEPRLEPDRHAEFRRPT
jgi:peptide/nickel transport system ATP-binding protein